MLVSYSTHLVDYIDDVKKDPKAIYWYHLSHQVVFFASTDDFYFGHSLCTVSHRV